MSESQSVTHKATKSLKWSAMMEIVTRIAQPLVFVILARLLTPEDFGVVGTAMIVIGFSNMFWEAGLGKALVQTKIPPERAANVVFWTNLVLGLIIYMVIFAAAPWVADFFKSPASSPVLRVLGLQVIILSLTSVQQFLFMRDLNFRQLFWAKLGMAITPACFSIPMAFIGYGVWALVAGTLAGSLTNMLILWSKSPWRPAWLFDWKIGRRLFTFGVWVIAESFGIWFIAWGDQLLVGKFLTIEDLGIYRVARNMNLLIFAFLVNPFLPVLYPTFSRLQDDKAKLKALFYKVNRVIMSLTLPVSAGLLIMGQPLAHILFGDKWHGLGFIFSILGFTLGISWIVAANAELYRAIGRPDINTKFMYFQLLLYIPTYLIVIPYGLHAFIFAKLVLCLVAILLHVCLCVRVLGLSYFYLWEQGKVMILATLGMSMAVLVFKEGLSRLIPDIPSAVLLITIVLTGMLVYSAILWLLDRTFVLDCRRLILKAVKM